MSHDRQSNLIRLRPRAKTLHISQGRSVFEADRDGLIPQNTAYGFYVHETRLLSRYEYLINDTAPQPVAVSNVREHSFLGYYVAFPADRAPAEKDLGSGQMGEVSEQTIELRVSRYVGGGYHEDLDFTNFTQQKTHFTFSILIAADFIDRNELHAGRQQFGKLTFAWRQNPNGAWELIFHYVAENKYDCQGERGTASLHRGVILRFANPATTPRYEGNTISFEVVLASQATWHTCVDVIAQIENDVLTPGYSCRSFDSTSSQCDTLREIFLSESACFRYPTARTLTPMIAEALGRAKEDLAALRLRRSLDETHSPPAGKQQSWGRK